MAAINFPSSPSNGDTHVVGGVTYTYNSAETKWKTTINSNAFLPLTGGTVSGNILMGGEIQHDGDTDTNISFDTDTILFDTAGSERFRVGSAGQLGIGGATYGTDGQVLTSTGATTAPAWENIPAPDGVWVSEGTAAANSSSSAFQFDNIDADTHTLVLDIAGLTQNGSGDNGPQIVLRMGTTATVDTGNNYEWRLYDSSNTQEGLQNTDSIRLTASVRTWQGHTWYGHVRISQVNGSSNWIVSWQLKTTDASVSGAANWHNTGNLSSLRLFQPGGRNWTGGSLHLRGYRL